MSVETAYACPACEWERSVPLRVVYCPRCATPVKTLGQPETAPSAASTAPVALPVASSPPPPAGVLEVSPPPPAPQEPPAPLPPATPLTASQPPVTASPARQEAEPPVALEVGSRLGGRFDLQARLARSGDVERWGARDVTNGDHVVLEVLDLRTAAPPNAEAFAARATALSSIDNASIARQPPLVSSGPLRYTAMAWPRSGTLADWLNVQAGPLPVEAVAAIGEQLLAGLEALHSKGYLHRAIAPAAIHVVHRLPGPVVLLGDLSHAHALSGGSAPATLTPAMLEAPRYVAPEVAAGATKIDARADLYAVAVVLAELRGLLGGLRRDGLPPADLDALLREALQPAPDRRPPTARAMRERWSVAAAAARGARPAGAPGASRWPTVRRWVMRGVLAAALAGAGFVSLPYIRAAWETHVAARTAQAEAQLTAEENAVAAAAAEAELEASATPEAATLPGPELPAESVTQPEIEAAPVQQGEAELDEAGRLLAGLAESADCSTYAEWLGTFSNSPSRPKAEELLRERQQQALRHLVDVQAALEARRADAARAGIAEGRRACRSAADWDALSREADAAERLTAALTASTATELQAFLKDYPSSQYVEEAGRAIQKRSNEAAFRRTRAEVEGLAKDVEARLTEEHWNEADEAWARLQARTLEVGVDSHPTTAELHERIDMLAEARAMAIVSMDSLRAYVARTSPPPMPARLHLARARIEQGADVDVREALKRVDPTRGIPPAELDRLQGLVAEGRAFSERRREWRDLARDLDAAAQPTLTIDVVKSLAAEPRTRREALAKAEEMLRWQPSSKAAALWAHVLRFELEPDGTGARQALTELATTESSVGATAREVLEAGVPPAWLTAPAITRCWACKHPVNPATYQCPHCLWVQAPIKSFRRLDGREWVDVTSRVVDGRYRLDEARRSRIPLGMGQGRTATAAAQTWTVRLGFEQGTLVLERALIASDTRAAAIEVRGALPSSTAWLTARSPVDILLGRPRPKAKVIQLARLTPYLIEDWSELVAFDMALDGALDQVQSLRANNDTLIFDLSFEADRLTEIRSRDGNFWRRLTWNKGRLDSESLELRNIEGETRLRVKHRTNDRGQVEFTRVETEGGGPAVELEYDAK